jgi:phosphopantetheinyl transferase (holo-ACP synthase)
MVKTTINLDTQVYRALVEEALERYGTTKTLSRLINEKLRSKINRKDRDIVKETAGMWTIKETGVEYTRRIRAGWRKRERRVHD